MDDLTHLLPAPQHLHLETVSVNDTAQVLTLHARTTATAMPCPQCGQPSTHIHSRYQRSLADVPWAAWAVRLQLTVRKFRCATAQCPQTIFAERLPSVAAAWSRRTSRAAAALRAIGLALGGRAGARLAHQLTLAGHRDLLLRLVRQSPRPTTAPPTVVGIDDWAWRKGQTYASLVVDLSTHRPLALLPDREPATVANWLRAHPSVHTVSRDRWNGYVQGITAGAPTARQVADRFHLLTNLSDVVVRALQPHHTAIERHWAQMQPAPEPVASPTLVPADRDPTLRERARQNRIVQTHQLYHTGWSQRAIAAHLGRHPKTIRRWLRLDPASSDSLCRRPRQRRLDPYTPYVVARWNSGCRNAVQLLREIQPQGYCGQITMLRAYLATLRRSQGLPARVRRIPGGATLLPAQPRCPSVRTLALLCVKASAVLQPDEQRMLAAAHVADPIVERTLVLAHTFAALVRERQADGLEAWLDQADQSGSPALKQFAAGLRRDLAAVHNALRLPYSNGPVEGQINRLKLLKRQGYGQAHLDLLERRFLAS